MEQCKPINFSWGVMMFKTTNSTSLIMIRLFKLSTLNWVSGGSLCSLRNCSISSNLSNVCVYSLIIFLTSSGSVVICSIA